MPRALARTRSRQISSLRYTLAFEIPAAPAAPVRGRALVHFRWNGGPGPIVLDFCGQVEMVLLDGRFEQCRQINEHLLIARIGAAPGEHVIDVRFTASDTPLNRSADFLYTILVPARARELFPCFDQPDLKARFSLTLFVPDGWQAVANAPECRNEEGRIDFEETAPLPTYLFAFAAGRFFIESVQDARPLRIFHRENEPGRIARNRAAIAGLHAQALEWLERYTGIPHPFPKLDIVLLPAFQFSGMEHPGAIFYDASALLLDESATEQQQLARAQLIAHETSHLWFGDLVTMRWFDDVWLKEVYASFLADKIVEPAFAGLDHELRFLLAHFPPAYAVDRTAGSHPIRQELENLNEAGSLYGPIIYHKAPIVMRELEARLTPDGLRDGLRDYLRTFAFDTADWPDLVGVLNGRNAVDPVDPVDVVAWSREWIESSGRPRRDFPSLQRLQYGEVIASDAQRETLLDAVVHGGTAVERGAAWILLWDEMLAARITVPRVIEAILAVVQVEPIEQIVQLVTGYLKEAFWRYVPGTVRAETGERAERVLLTRLTASPSPTMKGVCFGAFRAIASTPAASVLLERLWRGTEQLPGLPLAETDRAALALDLALRSPKGDAILAEQRERFESADRRARFEFVSPAASPDARTRRDFFERLSDATNRRQEPWVIDGLTLLNHPLRSASALPFLPRALDLVEEVARTGDIFFPARWLTAVLGGHSSPEAAAIVGQFLAERPAYPVRLRRLVAQASDHLVRR